MTLQEVNDLKSDVLFGSSHCSCSSCDSVLCFTKRNIKPNQCCCDVCNEPDNCIFIPGRERSNRDCFEDPTCHIRNVTSNKVKVKTTSGCNTSEVGEKESKGNIKVAKKNATAQITPQKIWNTTIKYKNDIKLSKSRNYQVCDNMPLGSIVKKMLTTYNDVSMNDIINKIKGVYDACSLKVCQCVVAKEKNICKCKPCECVDCKSYLHQADHSSAYQFYSCHSKAGPYVEQACQCKPCDCEKCKQYMFKIKDKGESLFIKKTMFNDPLVYRNLTSERVGMRESQRYLCKPCQCSKCKSLFKVHNNVVVGSVEEYLQHNDCLCLPCNCNNCRQLGAPIAHNLMRETSTDMVENTNCQCELCLNHSCQQTTESCRCARRSSVINKPFINDKQNIDIHRALVTKKSNYDKNNQTCTILIKILEGYKDKMREITDSKQDKSSSSAVACNTINKTTKVVSLSPKDSTSLCVKEKKNMNCQCNPCECKICDKYKADEGSVWKSPKFRSKCNCEVCHCLYCSALLQADKVPSENKLVPLPSGVSKANYKFTVNINRPVLPAAIQKIRSVRTKQRNNSKQVNKQTCTNSTVETGSECIYGTRNISLQIHAAPSSGTVGYTINNYLMQLPKINFHPSSTTYDNVGAYFNNDNALVKSFVNEIMQIDDFGNFNIPRSVSSQNVFVDDLAGSSVTSLWSFQKEMKIHSEFSTSSAIDNKLEICHTKECSLQNNVKHSHVAMQNMLLNKRKELNEPCIFCGMCTYYRKSTKYQNSDATQSIRQCFAKTNIALINHINCSRQSNNESKQENNDCRQSNNVCAEDNSVSGILNYDRLSQAAADVENEVDSKTVNTGDIVEHNANVSFMSYKDYFKQRNILFKAKLLTSELLKILYKYQKANKEFVSVTKKFSEACDDNLKKQDHLLFPQQSNVSKIKFQYSWSKLASLSKNQKEDFQSHCEIALKIINEDIIDKMKATINNNASCETRVPKQKETNEGEHDEMINNNYNAKDNNSKCKDDFSMILKQMSSSTMLHRNLSRGNINVLHQQTTGPKLIETVDLAPFKNIDDNFQTTNKVVVRPPCGEIKQVIQPICKNCHEIEPHEFSTNTQSGQKCLKCGLNSYSVNSLTLRRISGHTVFIKWEQPRNLSGVQGYELCVDGRVVKKICNPALTMAVVTCLPKSERILFTIQTLINAPSSQHTKASMMYRCTRANNKSNVD